MEFLIYKYSFHHVSVYLSWFAQDCRDVSTESHVFQDRIDRFLNLG